MTFPLIDLTGKKILVAGASSGIGAETSRLLSRLGASVILVARREQQLKETMATLEGTSYMYYCQDLALLDEIESFVKRVIDDNGPLDGYVHCAGISVYRPISLFTPDVVREVMNINFGSFIEMVRCCTKRKRFNPGMSIVGISSVAAQQGNQTKTAYAASKAAMDAAVRCLGKELAPKGIRINTVAPALIKTAIFDELKESNVGAGDTENVIARQYLGVGEPQDVANMIAFLLSDASKFMSGSTVAVDGGRLSS
ncbi:MAG: SDR family oxidoreductase [Lentisphaeria bacterium]|nr:SDR family oxidoreductase [Lentisphaeria bacterium]